MSTSTPTPKNIQCTIVFNCPVEELLVYDGNFEPVKFEENSPAKFVFFLPDNDNRSWGSVSFYASGPRPPNLLHFVAQIRLAQNDKEGTHFVRGPLPAGDRFRIGANIRWLRAADDTFVLRTLDWHHIEEPTSPSAIRSFLLRRISAKNVKGLDISEDELKWVIDGGKDIRQPQQQATEVTVFYGTNRNSTGQAGLGAYYGKEAAALQMGTCRVSIPPNHATGQLERPRKVLFWQRKENPAKDVVLTGISPFPTHTDFYNWVKTHIGQTAQPSALIFIHGFNTTFEEAAWRTGQLAYDMPYNGLTGFFSWPSTGSEFSYFADIEKADTSVAPLEDFIKQLVMHTGIKALHFLAHSMGNRLLTAALKNLFLSGALGNNISTITQVILAAPDLDTQNFDTNFMPSIKNIGKRRTLYVCDKDRALHLSEKFRGNRQRLGDGRDGLYVAPGLDTVDASHIIGQADNHSYLFEVREMLGDMYYLLHQGHDPATRRLHRNEINQLPYWYFPR